jgi:hypothetical protein
MVDLGVISNQQDKIVAIAKQVLFNPKQIQSVMSMKFAIVCLQFVLHSKSLANWADEHDSSTEIVAHILSQIGSIHAQVHQQAVKSICILLQNQKINQMGKISKLIKQSIEARIAGLLNSAQRVGDTIQLDPAHQQ